MPVFQVCGFEVYFSSEDCNSPVLQVSLSRRKGGGGAAPETLVLHMKVEPDRNAGLFGRHQNSAGAVATVPTPIHA